MQEHYLSCFPLSWKKQEIQGKFFWKSQKQKNFFPLKSWKFIVSEDRVWLWQPSSVLYGICLPLGCRNPCQNGNCWSWKMQQLGHGKSWNLVLKFHAMDKVMSLDDTLFSFQWSFSTDFDMLWSWRISLTDLSQIQILWKFEIFPPHTFLLF